MIERILEIVNIEKSQADFCRKTGIGSSKIAYWIKNPQSSPAIEAIVSILEVYSVNANWLIRGVGDKFTKKIDDFSKNDDNFTKNMQVSNGNSNKQIIGKNTNELYEMLLKEKDMRISYLEKRVSELEIIVGK